MLNLYYDPHGSKIFDMSKPVAGAEVSNPPPTPTAGSLCTQCESERETVARDREEALKEKERRISELEKELSLIKVRLALMTGSICTMLMFSGYMIVFRLCIVDLSMLANAKK